MKFIDLAGQRFGRWIVKSQAGKDKFGNSLWDCICDCGTLKAVLGHKMRSGESHSCGCLARELHRAASTTHGMSFTPEWNSFHGAKARCTNSKSGNWTDYGGRGIEFRFKSFEEFIAEIGPRPEPKFEYSLERIDNNGHYEKGNIRWATKVQQARNRRCDKCEIHLARIAELERSLAQSRRAVESVIMCD
jgi:hypothetical protein